MRNLLPVLFVMLATVLFAQDEKVKMELYDGIVVVGYADNGAFLNFTGPNINATYGKSKFMLGMLPSLRFKADHDTPKNAFVTPGLGIGFTYAYKIYAIQLPLYYTTKTATQNGSWHIGIGLGLRLNELRKKGC